MRILFALAFSCSNVLDRGFRCLYPGASKRKDDMSERATIGLNVSLLETQNRTDVGHPLAVNYELSQDGENIVIAPQVDYLDFLARGGPINFRCVLRQHPVRSEIASLDIKVVNNGNLVFIGRGVRSGPE